MKKIHTPFQRLSKSNITMDQLAGDKMKDHNDYFSSYNKSAVYSQTAMGCYTDQDIFIGNIRRDLYDSVNVKIAK